MNRSAMMMCMVAGVVGVASTWAMADWPGYRGVGAQGIATAKAGPESLSGLKEIWRVPLGEAFGEIAVAGDKAVVLGKRGDDEMAMALDAKTGKELWATRIDKTVKEKQGGDGPRTTPAIDGGKAYVYGTYMKLYCLDLETGAEVWKHEVLPEFGGKQIGGISTWGNAVSPTVVDDVVIVEGGGKEKGILAFDKTTGKLVWASTSDLVTHASPTVATIAGQKQVICFMQSGLVSVEPKTGSVLWKFAHPYKVSTAASAVVGGKNGDIVYCSAGYGVGAAGCRVTRDGDKWTATKLWRTEAEDNENHGNQNHWSTPVAFGGYVYGLYGHNDPKGNLSCVDIETGKPAWIQKGIGTQGGVILVGDKLVVHDTAGELVLVAASPDAYKELGRVSEFKGKSWIGPSYSDGNIFARSATEGACFAVDVK